eukprot:9132844-Pyramimonas_sp.AAC.2
MLRYRGYAGVGLNSRMQACKKNCKDDTVKLDRTQVWYCRKLMQGAATKTTILPDGTERKTSLNSDRVLTLLRLARVSLELRIQRLRWYQTMFRAPEKKTQRTCPCHPPGPADALRAGPTGPQ